MPFSGTSKKALQGVASFLKVLSLLIPLASLGAVLAYFHAKKGAPLLSQIKASVDPLDMELYERTVRPRAIGDYQVILDTYKRQTAAAPAEEPTNALSELKKKLKLIALTPSDVQAFLSAYIRNTSTHIEDFYHIGDEIEKATLTAINTQENSVTLSLGRDSIKLYEKETSDQLGAETPESGSEKGMMTVDQNAQVQPGPSKKKKLEPYKSYQDKNDPHHWYVDPLEKQYLERHIFQLAKQVKFSVKTDPQKGIVGLEINHLDQASILAQRGFHPGDVIKSVNDLQFTSTNSMRQMLIDTKYINAQSYSVTVERNGQPVTLQYDILKNQ